MRTVLISGGSSGLGKALAKRLSGKCRVVILADTPEKTEAAAREIGCDFVVADVTNYEAVSTAVGTVLSKYGSIDCLVNNAGIWIQGPLEAEDPERIKKAMDVNALGTIFLTHAALPSMKERRQGRIINVVSQAGLTAKADRSVYNASKWAITGFTKSMAFELIPHNITVVGFYPGSMKTDLFEKAGDHKDVSHYMELEDVTRAIEFIIETRDDINIPEFGMKPAWY